MNKGVPVELVPTEFVEPPHLQQKPGPTLQRTQICQGLNAIRKLAYRQTASIEVGVYGVRPDCSAAIGWVICVCLAHCGPIEQCPRIATFNGPLARAPWGKSFSSKYFTNDMELHAGDTTNAHEHSSAHLRLHLR